VRDPYWHDDTATLYAGDPREVLAEMPDHTVDCMVTAPPAWTPEPDPAQAHQKLASYGHEPTPALYVAALRRVLAEAHRVLADEGTCWLVTSDRYAGQAGRRAGPPAGRHARRIRDHALVGLPASTLIGLPWQIAFALQDDGWIIRNAIIWHHPDAPTEPATDRLPTTYELIFLLVKQRRYHFDLDPIREAFHRPEVAADPPAVGGTRAAAGCLGASARRRPGRRHTHRRGSGKYGAAAENCRSRHGAAMLPTGQRHAAAHPAGRNPGDVWSIPASPSSGAVPIELPLRCIAAGCRPGGTVLDPFAGSAATGLAARQLGCSFIGIAPDASACEQAKARLSGQQGGGPQ
jgi:site-specific DNA-methyltransferase (cytosine-N4-specific)